MSRPHTVVFDTNLFVGAGFNPASASAELLDAVRSGELRMVWSEETRAETRRILEKIPPLDWEAVAELFREEDRVDVTLAASSFTEIPDPDDRKFAALAAETGALLVSSDAHLLAGGDHRFVVCTPGAAREGQRDRSGERAGQAQDRREYREFEKGAVDEIDPEGEGA
ncbi:MAG: PIN domain-containing protein [Longimicrobiales bacterium]|nr:PIN domain-containing protein [Longimicrobiales bacterium]